MKSSITHRLIYKYDRLREFINSSIGLFQINVMKFFKEPETVDLIRSVKKEVDSMLRPYEAFLIYSIAKAQSVLEGDMAEVGIYQGGSAKLICEAKGNRKLHLFDTFEGLPDVSEIDKNFEDIDFLHTKDINNTTIESVQKYLEKYDNVFFYKGKFPDTAEPIKDLVFSFVHLDADLYESTLNGLKFFYPRLLKGGIIISHDYVTIKGVRKAFEDYFSDKSVPVIELVEQQCMVIKF